ncbi:hypothetical protein PENSPDRAFT_306508 [Peniophora sp. CONT]|nr:hypothetical protein PENSPDRAFT_306508 [Peniophora sp. CONT]
MSCPTSAPATSAGFANYNQQQPQNTYTTSQIQVNPCFNTQGYTQGHQFRIHPSAFGMPQQKNNAYSNSLGLTGPYNFAVPQRALPFKVEAAAPALSYRAPSQQSSSLVARTRQYANYARVEPYMHARMMRWPAMPPQSNMAPPPYSTNPPSRPMSIQGTQSFAPQFTSAGPMLAPKPVRSWHIEALQSLSAMTDAGTEPAQSKLDEATVKAEEQDKAKIILPAELDVNNGIYRAYRADTGQRHILSNHTVESALSPSDRAELAAMRRLVSRGEQPTTCKFSGCDHVASCTRYLVKHVHAHLRIRWQCEFCERSFGARADMLTEHVKKAHPEMLAVFKIRRMHRKAPVTHEPGQGECTKSDD